MAKVLLKMIQHEPTQPSSMYAQAVISGGLLYPEFSSILVEVSVEGTLTGPDIIVPEYDYDPEGEDDDVHCAEETVNNTLTLSGSGSKTWHRMSEEDELLDRVPGLLYDSVGDIIGVNTTDPRQFSMSFSCFDEAEHDEDGTTVPDIFSAYCIYCKSSQWQSGLPHSDFGFVAVSDIVEYDGSRIGGDPYDCTPSSSIYDSDTDVFLNGAVSFFRDSASHEIAIIRRCISKVEYPQFDDLSSCFPVDPLYIENAGFPIISFDEFDLDNCIKDATFGSSVSFSGHVDGYISEAAITAGWVPLGLKLTWTISIS